VGVVVGLLPGTQEEFDGIVNRLLVFNFGENQILLRLSKFVLQASNIFAATVGTLDLAIAKQVAVRQQLILEQVKALGVVFSPVVPIGELEEVNIPFRRRKVVVQQFGSNLVGRADSCTATFTGVVKGVFVDFFGYGIVNDVTALDAVVLVLEPRINPEGFGANNLFLLVGQLRKRLSSLMGMMRGLRRL
jgi:hypothetical protein